ncbi:MAG: hypothetical protein ACYDAO_01550 [Thermoplasmataceae archaeon]
MSGSYISRTCRRQLLLLHDMIENYIEEDNPVRGCGEIQGSLVNREVIPDHEILSGDKAGEAFTIG